ncbi:MAG: 6-phosphogluconolactonase [bacterium]|nr:6-phosphogluconolactonase [bacterium]
MFEEIRKLLLEKKIDTRIKDELIIIRINQADGLKLAKEIIYKAANQKTALFLSGGSTPKPLYEAFAEERKLNIGAAAMIDERYGKPFHENSNEKMVKETGLLLYLKEKNIPFYSALWKDKSQEKSILNYDEAIRYLLFNFPKNMAILGIGSDGHTAGIAPNKRDFSNPLFEKEKKGVFVGGFDDGKDFSTGFGKRITLTFSALSMMDFILILAFGKNKRKALSKMFEKGDLADLPARFYLEKDIVRKTLLITDQKV